MMAPCQSVSRRHSRVAYFFASDAKFLLIRRLTVPPHLARMAPTEAGSQKLAQRSLCTAPTATEGANIWQRRRTPCAPPHPVWVAYAPAEKDTDKYLFRGTGE